MGISISPILHESGESSKSTIHSISQPSMWTKTESRFLGEIDSIWLIFSVQTKSNYFYVSNTIYQNGNLTHGKPYCMDKAKDSHLDQVRLGFGGICR
jgi:hypothetical protein